MNLFLTLCLLLISQNAFAQGFGLLNSNSANQVKVNTSTFGAFLPTSAVTVQRALNYINANAGSGGGAPGGSNGTLQYRVNSTTFGGVSGSGVDAGGNVGIGSNSPSANLDVYGGVLQVGSPASGSTGQINLSYDGGNATISRGDGIITMDKSLQIKDNSGGPETTLQIVKGTGQTAPLIDGTNAAAGDLFRLTVAGNVGISSVTPGQKLDVQGNARVLNGNLGIGTSVMGNALVVNGSIKSSAFGTATKGLIFSNNGVEEMAFNSVVLDSTNLSKGAIAAPAISLGTTIPVLYGAGTTYRLTSKGDFKVTDSSSNILIDTLNNLTLSHPTGNVDISAPAGNMTLSTDGDFAIAATSNPGSLAQITASTSVTLSSSLGSSIGLDGSGGATLRSSSDQGGIYTPDCTTYVGWYSMGLASVFDCSGNVAIQNGGGPSAGQYLQVGADPGVGSNMSFMSPGGQFVDFYGTDDYSAIRLGRYGIGSGFEFAVPGFDGEFHSDALAGDVVFKGDVGGSNNFRFGPGSGASAFHILSGNTVLVGTASTSAGYGVFQVTGNQYVSGNIGLGQTSANSKLSITGTKSIETTGNVSIGTTASNARLTVIGGNVGIGTALPNAVLTVWGHLNTHTTAPAVSSCGTSPSIVGSDMAGKVTTGTGVITSCVLTFATAWTRAPSCWVNNESTVALTTDAVSTTTTLTIAGSAAITNNTIAYGCVGWE